MKLSVITKEHINQASILIDQHGIPRNYVSSQYFVLINGKEYQFKYLVNKSYQLATNSDLDFESNKAYRNYIEGLGFSIVYHEEGFNFFTQDELYFYSSIANQGYSASNKNQHVYKEKLQPLMAKTNFWINQLVFPGFNVRDDNRWLGARGQKIAPYIWPRIYLGEDQDVFFNVEINGEEQWVGYKLDGYFSTSKKLTDDKLKLLEEFKELINWEWPKISFEELKGYDWKRLVAESRNYVEKYLPHYERLKLIMSKESKLARITWNTNGWIKPSGRLGKSSNKTHEFEHGFGHEEWLFDGDKIINGYKYGFLEPIHKFRSKYEGNLFDITLYTKNARTGQNYWVTTLHDVEVLRPDEAEEILAHYKKQGWYEEMKGDLYNLSLEAERMDSWISDSAISLFNVKFKASQLNEIENELIPVVNENDITSNRYILLNISPQDQTSIISRNQTSFSYETSGSKNTELSVKSIRIGQQKEIELELKHNIIQSKLLRYLQQEYGKENVKRECKAYGASRIDITQKTSTGYIFYEIKTFNSLKTSIREGLGQLLEYSLYPNVVEAEKIVLVSDVSPSEELKQYILHLKKFIKMPFFYIHFSIEKEEVISEF